MKTSANLMASNAQLRSVAGMTKNGNVLRVALNICAWLALLTLPTHNVTPEAEPSWCGILNYAEVHHLQFGIDLIFNYGPLGFLALHSFSQQTWFWIVLFQAISRAVYLLMLNAVPLPSARGSRLPLLLAAVILPLFNVDVFYLAFMTFVGILFCQPPSNQNWRKILKWSALALVAVIALIKVSFFFYSLLIVFCISAWLLANTRAAEAVRIISLWIICLAVSWTVLARQQLANFPRWLRASYEVAQSYQLSQSIQPTKNVLFYGILLLVLVMGTLIAALRARPRSFPIILLFATGTFMAWKQGFTRADANHFPAFFLFSGIIIVALPLLLGLDGWKWTWFVACLCLGWGSMGNSKFPGLRFIENARFLCSHHEQRKADARIAAMYDLPNMRRELQSSSVDVIGTSQAIAIINHFNYRPAPVFQTFLAGNAWLAKANADFYCSAAAPQYVIYKQQTIDERLETLDSALVGLILSTRYKQVMEEKGYTLLHRTSAEHALPQLELTQSGTVQPGEEIPMEGATWCKIDMQEMVAEKLCRLFYQSARIRVSLRTADGVYTRRFVPSMARTGFLIPEKVLSLAIEDSRATRTFYRRRITFSLYRTDEVGSQLPVEDLESSTQLEPDAQTGTSKRRKPL